ncbi:peptidase M41 [Wenyingzhuangia fucanilytica]|uniref:ATP-dependent zinc metalloprotease FtsH n=1 Tax=Wenyingzhuangia fucanilytica TaxID=1790137 RepID=A0A1B1Y3A0_9FLAO|nr:ATP-dependent zinc metalloprotease FtsH [Wenyingzhuangia fucanilytica]ANW95256.1 peptidase M41 [Wenyingzhuangia fucanilytica]
MNKEPKNQPKPNPNGFKPKFNSYWIYAAIIAVIISFNFFGNNITNTDISRNKFEDLLRSNSIENILIVNNDYAEIHLTEEAQKEFTSQSKDESLPWVNAKPVLTYNFGSLENFENVIKENKEKYNLSIDLKNVNKTDLFDSILGFLPFILILGLWIFFMRRMSGGAAGGGAGGQIFSIGKSKAKLFDENQKVKVSFKDVAGLEGAKEEVQEIVDFLKSPEKYTNLGGKIPKGALLVGPPGTGKTLLAKAVAGEAGVPFFSLSGSDFVEMFVGVGASRVRDLFKQAAQKSPSIIFIDEIDAIGRARGKNNMTGGNDERENTLNQLLTEMDGFGTDVNVIVIAATNRADVLDKALMRAGRFDRQIYVDLPDLNERNAIFKVHLKPLKLGNDVKVDFLAQQTPGFSGADIANLCNEAALMAARKGKEAIENEDFLDSVDRIVGGLEKKNKIISAKEKKTIAFHEAGHATASWMLEHAAPLVKVTIVPRGQSLGAAWYLPEERMIVQTEQMLDEMCATLAGRAAEKIIFDRISTGALSDLEKVTKQARAMVSIYGLSEKVGNLTYYDSSGQEYGFTKPYSENTAQLIDEEISLLIEQQYQRAIQILTENKDKLTELAERLLEKEVIFKDDLIKIFGQRAFLSESEVLEKKLKDQEETTEENNSEVKS